MVEYEGGRTNGGRAPLFCAASAGAAEKGAASQEIFWKLSRVAS
jgi:hypothetical protein